MVSVVLAYSSKRKDCNRRKRTFATGLRNDGQVPDPVNWTMQRAQKHELQKSLSSMVLEQRCVADIAEQHFDLFLP